MPPATLPFRQVHLDFHTSEHIAGIGQQFAPDRFADTLVQARVNSITCFARCHHGWFYFDTKRFPERRHPHLVRNLLKEQIEACHARGIRVPIYVTVQWDHYTAEQHPEWLVLDENGRVRGTPPYQAGFYRELCVNSPYLEFLRTHVAEILEMLPVDGFFFDIVRPLDDSSIWTRRGMREAGLDPADPEARRAYGRQVVETFKADMTAFVRQYNDNCTIFYNAGHIGPKDRPAADAYTHFELESLPSGGWGYAHFPLAARYARTLAKPVLGMTGKFHTSWGDFHSYKNEAALAFECFRMLSLGAACSVGDQLHPNGAIDPATYDLIGAIYREVQAKEPWCVGAHPIVEIGVFTPEAYQIGDERVPSAAIGALRMLEEGGHQFDFVDSHTDFDGYRVLVLPDEIPVSQQLAARLNDFLANGGALIASHQSGLDNERFAESALGVRGRGEAPFSPDFILPRGDIGRGLPTTEHVMYLRAMAVEATGEVLAGTTIPYFNRTHEHFCSHRHTPSAGKAGGPAIVRKGQTIYFAHPIFRQYEQNAPRWYRTLFLNALALLLPAPLLRHGGPSTLLATLMEQPAERRWVVHLMHYIPTRRARDFDTVEDVIPLNDLTVSVRAPARPREVLAVPQGDGLHFSQDGEYVTFTLPKLIGHQMVALSFD